MLISRPSPILIFSIQRLNYITKKKNDCIVNISNDLEIKNYIDEDILKNKNKIINYIRLLIILEI